MPSAFRVGILWRQKKEHDVQIFAGIHLVIALSFHRRHRRSAAQRHAGGAGCLFARRSALLPSGDQSRRFHHSRLPAAKSPQDIQGLRSGKTHRDENCPVASWIIHPRHRALILSFYNFVRTADDIADHATLNEKDKLGYLDLLEAELLGKGDSQPEAVNLRRALAERSMPARHALDVLVAVRMDVTKLRYENWDEVIHYCRYSAMPGGRFMLDVYAEISSTWAAADALCAGLQINNHLQDCGKDFRDLNRVYLPRDALEAAGASVEALGALRASAPLLQCLHSLAVRTEALFNQSRPLSAEVRDF